MKINQTFEVTFNVNKYPKEDRSINHDGILSDKVEKLDLTFTLSEKEAGYFLFKFYPGFFKFGDYQVGMMFDETHKLKNIILYKDDYVYIITNIVQTLSKIHEGYFRLISMSKINDIMEFDFNIPEDNDEIHEEFEDEE
jgi:hypothetical protein